MVVAFLITAFALWLLLAPRGRARLRAEWTERPLWLGWMALGVGLLMVCFWGMLLPALRAVTPPALPDGTELWRAAGVLFLGWAVLGGGALLLRGRL